MAKVNLSRRAALKLSLLSGASFGLAACATNAAVAPQASTPPAQPEATLAPVSSTSTSAPQEQATPAPTKALDVQKAAEPTVAPTPVLTLAPTLAPAPATPDDDDEPTLAQTEGPYYTPNTPERASLLEPGMPGTQLVVSGRVVDTQGTPIDRALIDFWHCDNAGQYDNAGYTLRGHQFTNTSGQWQLTTLVPGLYSGRTRHIHVKVQAPNQPVLTTQLYFPGEPGNARDGIYDASLEMDVKDAADGKAATFTFVLNI